MAIRNKKQEIVVLAKVYQNTYVQILGYLSHMSLILSHHALSLKEIGAVPGGAFRTF